MLGLDLSGGLNHAGQPFDALGFGSLVNASKMRVVETAATADLDGSSNL